MKRETSGAGSVRKALGRVTPNKPPAAAGAGAAPNRPFPAAAAPNKPLAGAGAAAAPKSPPAGAAAAGAAAAGSSGALRPKSTPAGAGAAGAAATNAPNKPPAGAGALQRLPEALDELDPGTPEVPNWPPSSGRNDSCSITFANLESTSRRQACEGAVGLRSPSSPWLLVVGSLCTLLLGGV